MSKLSKEEALVELYLAAINMANRVHFDTMAGNILDRIQPTKSIEEAVEEIEGLVDKHNWSEEKGGFCKTGFLEEVKPILSRLTLTDNKELIEKVGGIAKHVKCTNSLCRSNARRANIKCCHERCPIDDVLSILKGESK